MISSIDKFFQKCYLLQGNIEKKRDRKEVQNHFSAGYVISLIYLVIISKALPSTLYSGIDVEQGINVWPRKLEMFPNE